MPPTTITADLDTITKPAAAALAGLFAGLAGVSAAPGVSKTDTSAAPAAGTAPAATADKFFPADAGDADFPSPENSRMLRNADGSISGKPYLVDKDGAVHRLVAPTDAVPNGYTVNGTWAQGGGSDHSPAGLILLRQGKVFAQTSGGIWQNFRNGSLYNTGLPDAWVADDSGTPNKVAPSSVTLPALPTRATPAPGSSGTILLVGADRPYATLTAAIEAAKAGDTISLAGTFKEAPPALAVPLKIVWEDGALLDLTGLTDKLAHGKGAIVPMTDVLLVNPCITGTAMDQDSAQGTAAIRPETGCGYIDVQGGELFKNQNGIAGGDIPCVVTVTDGHLHGNGLGDGYTHNIYMSNGTRALRLKNTVSVDPNNGHGVKSRAFETTITGGEIEAFASAALDVPQGSVEPCVLDGVTITKKAGAWNHTVLDYATENTDSGNGGMILRNCKLNIACDNPVMMVGGGSVVTVEATTTFSGTKPTAQGGTVKGL